MPLFLIPFVSWLGTSFATAVAFFISRKGILFAAVTALITVLGLAITALIEQVDGYIGSVLPSSVGFVTPFVPSNLGLCVSLVIATEIACTSYKMFARFIEWKSKALLG